MRPHCGHLQANLYRLSAFNVPTIWDPIVCTIVMCVILYYTHYNCTRGPGSVVGIATAYGLDGPGIESRWGEIFRICPDRPWGPPSLLYNGYRVFTGGKAAGAWPEPPTTSTADVKERVVITLLPSGTSWPVLWWIYLYLYIYFYLYLHLHTHLHIYLCP